MLRSPINEEGAEPYWYARVLGIYHANIWAENSAIPGAKNTRRMDFLWVRWFGEEPDYLSGPHRARLPHTIRMYRRRHILFPSAFSPHTNYTTYLHLRPPQHENQKKKRKLTVS